MKILTMTSTGQEKVVNQDSIFGKKWVLSSLNVGVGAIADGMGGYNYGDKYSQIAIQEIKNELSKEIYSGHDLSLVLDNIFHAADVKIKQCNYEQNKLGGTTLTIVLCTDEAAIVKNIGDSRCYLIRDHNLVQISEDHALFDENGKKTSKLIRCLGIGMYKNPYTRYLDIKKDDCLLLCSDGFYNLLSNDEILQFSQCPEDKFEEVLQILYRRHEKDNISAITIHF